MRRDTARHRNGPSAVMRYFTRLCSAASTCVPHALMPGTLAASGPAAAFDGPVAVHIARVEFTPRPTRYVGSGAAEGPRALQRVRSPPWIAGLCATEPVRDTQRRSLASDLRRPQRDIDTLPNARSDATMP